MIVAITGGGFVGKRLIEAHLRAGDSVRVLVRNGVAMRGEFPGVLVVEGDLTAPAGISGRFLEGAGILYHCAAEIRNVERMKAVNVDGTARLLEAAAGKIGRWVQLSSVGVYGRRRNGTLIEDTPPAPENVYEQSKAEADRLVAAAARTGSFEYTILRPSIIFGPEMPNQSLRQMALMIRRGLLFFVGPPGASANYIHVDNVVHALMLCAAHSAAPGRIFNLSDHRSMEDFVGTIAAILGVAPPALRLPAAPIRLLAGLAGLIPGSPLTIGRADALTVKLRYPIDRIQGELGYGHLLSMEEGLARTLEAFFPELRRKR